MKTRKRRFEQFLFYDYTGIERHLEKMASRGWQLQKITRFYWEYRKTEPQKQAYTVTYFSEASEFNPYPTENQRIFRQYCKDAGWTFVAEWAQMQIFCSAKENPVPIETDESVKLKAIHRAMKKNFLPGSVVLILLFIFQIYLQLHMIADDPISHLAMGSSPFVALIWFVLIIQTLFALIGYIAWYQKSKRAVHMGGPCAESVSGYKKAFHVLTGIEAVLLVFALLPFFTSARSNILAVVLGIINVTVIIVMVFAIRNALKRAEVSRKVNLSVTMVSLIILSIVLSGITIRCIVWGANAGWFGNKPVETYTTTIGNCTYTWDIYHDPLPLKVEDLQDVDYDHYSYEWTARESFLLAQYVARQDSLPGVAPELNYSIVDVKRPALFDLCLDYYLNMFDYVPSGLEKDQRHYLQTDAPAWQADEVYQLYDGDAAEPRYVLCWGNRIVYINFNEFDEIPTAEQIAVTVEKLSK